MATLVGYGTLRASQFDILHWAPNPDEAQSKLLELKHVIQGIYTGEYDRGD